MREEKLNMIEIDINKNRCKGCGLCTDVCPKGILSINANIDTPYGKGCAEALGDCVGCACCALVCPDIAIKFVERS